MKWLARLVFVLLALGLLFASYSWRVSLDRSIWPIASHHPRIAAAVGAWFLEVALAMAAIVGVGQGLHWLWRRAEWTQGKGWNG